MVPIVKEAGWASGLVWMGTENLVPTGIETLDHPACNVNSNEMQE
jgi:hypothetical protein